MIEDLPKDGAFGELGRVWVRAADRGQGAGTMSWHEWPLAVAGRRRARPARRASTDSIRLQLLHTIDYRHALANPARPTSGGAGAICRACSRATCRWPGPGREPARHGRPPVGGPRRDAGGELDRDRAGGRRPAPARDSHGGRQGRAVGSARSDTGAGAVGVSVRRGRAAIYPARVQRFRRRWRLTHGTPTESLSRARARLLEVDRGAHRQVVARASGARTPAAPSVRCARSARRRRSVSGKPSSASRWARASAPTSAPAPASSATRAPGPRPRAGRDRRPQVARHAGAQRQRDRRPGEAAWRSPSSGCARRGRP